MSTTIEVSKSGMAVECGYKCVRFGPLYIAAATAATAASPRTVVARYSLDGAESKQGVGTIQLPRFNLHALPSPASCRHRRRRRCLYPYCTARLDARQAGRQTGRQSPNGSLACSSVRPRALVLGVRE